MTTTTPSSPPITPQKAEKQHYDTPHRSRLQGVHAFLVAKEIPHDEREIFEIFNIKPGAGNHMIEPGASSRTFHHSVEVETWGRKRKVISNQVRKADAILQNDSLGLEAKGLSWKQLATKVGADVNGRTIHSIMRDALDYNKYLACVKGWLFDRAKERRVEWATTMINRYPQPKDWYQVRFSDEVHFSYGPEGQLRIIQKPGTWKRPDCIQHWPPPPKEDKDQKRMHC